jgi:hypothetical protein
MSEVDEITQALLAGTMGIAKHGLAVGGVERPDDAPEPRPQHERHGFTVGSAEWEPGEPQYATSLIATWMAEARQALEDQRNDEILALIRASEPRPDENGLRHGRIDEHGAWVPKRRRVRTGDFVVLDGGTIRPADAADHNIIGYAVGDLTPDNRVWVRFGLM